MYYQQIQQTTFIRQAEASCDISDGTLDLHAQVHFENQYVGAGKERACFQRFQRYGTNPKTECEYPCRTSARVLHMDKHNLLCEQRSKERYYMLIVWLHVPFLEVYERCYEFMNELSNNCQNDRNQ